VQEYYHRRFPTPTQRQLHPPVIGCTQADVDRLKGYLKAHGKWGWKGFKKSYGKSDLGDIEFCTYLNSIRFTGKPA